MLCMHTYTFFFPNFYKLYVLKDKIIVRKFFYVYFKFKHVIIHKKYKSCYFKNFTVYYYQTIEIKIKEPIYFTLL